MSILLSHAPARDRGSRRAASPPLDAARPGVGKVASFVTRMLDARRRDARTGDAFARVDSGAMAVDDFHASDSLGLDGAPSMVFDHTMPPYSRDIDRPAHASTRPRD